MIELTRPQDVALTYNNWQADIIVIAQELFATLDNPSRQYTEIQNALLELMAQKPVFEHPYNKLYYVNMETMNTNSKTILCYCND